MERWWKMEINQALKLFHIQPEEVQIEFLKTLPQRQRQALIAKECGKSYHEIARSMQIGYQGAKTHVRLAVISFVTTYLNKEV